MMKQILTLILLFGAFLLRFLLAAKQRSQNQIRASKQINIALKQTSFGTFTAQPPKPPSLNYSYYQLRTAQNEIFTVARYISKGQPVIVLPFMFGHEHSTAIRALASQMGRFDVHVLCQRGCGANQIKNPAVRLVNEYTELDELDALVKSMQRAPIVVGMSAGAMRAVHYAALNPGKVRKVVALWCSQEAVAIDFGEEIQTGVGKQALSWMQKNIEHVKANGVDEKMVTKLMETPTMAAWDEIYASRLGMDLGTYYKHINVTRLIPNLEDDTTFISVEGDIMTEGITADSEILGNKNVHLIVLNKGTHLRCGNTTGDAVCQLAISLL